VRYRDFAREARAFLEYLAGSEDQPRVPAGSPDGGEFGSGGGKVDPDEKKDLHVSATREQWSKRPNRESLSKRLGKTAIQIRERDHHECQYCHKPEVTVPPAKISNKHALDHLVPRIDGGKDVASNLVLACQSCNSARHSMTVKEWSVYARAKYGLKFSPARVYRQAEKPLPEIKKAKAA
jgi:hypothetical protein